MLAYDFASRKLVYLGVGRGWKFDSALRVNLELCIMGMAWRSDYIQQDWWELIH